MLKVIDGFAFAAMLESGIRNIDLHRKELNDLNVFPVPDGDTGTNMLMTMRQGYAAISDKSSLSAVAHSFAASAVLGARGNSGVILSQFFKGISEGFATLDSADAGQLAEALTLGCKRAYGAVAKPVEGTMLTVLREATEELVAQLPLGSTEEALDVFLRHARLSLERTPELLPVLKKAGVVDSGGTGIVRFFEGVKKYLSGEEIEVERLDDEAVSSVDMSLFNKDTVFEYGYCCEGVLQLKCDESAFDRDAFVKRLGEVGESIVASLEGDKVKLHIHAKKLGRVMDICQSYGELLTVKIENMTVQNMEKNGAKEEEAPEKFLVREACEQAKFAVVAVATTPLMQRTFFEMGADVVIYSEIAPSSQDFAEAFALAGNKEILAFPNCANSILACMQATGLYKKARVTVINSRSTADCYASLALLDFDADAKDAIALSNSTVASMRTFSVYHATKDFRYGKAEVKKNSFFALKDKKVVGVDDTLLGVTLSVSSEMYEKDEFSVVTVFYGRNIADEYIELLKDRLAEACPFTEVAAVATDETVYSLMISLE